MKSRSESHTHLQLTRAKTGVYRKDAKLWV